MLEEVLYPYDRLFGQYRKPEDLWGLAARARERFASSPAASGLGDARGLAVRLVFDDYLRAVEELREWGLELSLADSRVMWLPLQVALRPEQHDSQEELDSILSRAQRNPLTGGNHVFYWNGQQWQLSLHRSIHDARDYHVLWLHDYDGVDAKGAPDDVGYYISVEGYLKALTERVREFDATGRAAQTRFVAKQGIVFAPDELANARVDLARLFGPYLDVARELPAAVRESAVMYMTVGSLNKDARGMMTDGEVLQVTAGPWAMWAVADMWSLTGSTTWIESQEELDALLPPYTQMRRRIGRWVRKVI